MPQAVPEPDFSGIMKRISTAAGVHTQTDLANFFGIRRSSVSDARRRGKIPASWLITLLRVKNISPEWILTGMGPRFLLASPGRYDTEEEFAERQAEDEALSNVSSRALADELVRRIVLAQGKILFG
ncbi:helix-turn-helix domain-containing protein [Desulfovibrio porci]|uniref:helix-turn-helix domain-containing protein n=1 Tax=Desulfovibrio porci TaxID=2605782 RepID=UPI003A953EDA